MKPVLHKMDKRCGTNRGVVSKSKEVEVYDINNELIRSFGSAGELEKKSEKFLGVFISYQKILLHCRNGKPFDGKYYLKIKENYIF